MRMEAVRGSSERLDVPAREQKLLADIQNPRIPQSRRYQELPASANRESSVRVSQLEPGMPQMRGDADAAHQQQPPWVSSSVGAQQPASG